MTLALTRKPGDSILLSGDITITVVEVNGQHVRITVDAPDDIVILRAELYDGTQDLEGST